MEMDLDRIIANIRMCAAELDILELSGQRDVSFCLLMAEIQRESRRLKADFMDGEKICKGAGHAPNVIGPGEREIFNENDLKNASARWIDERMSHFWLYRRLRPAARMLYRRKNPYRTIEGRRLLAYDGEGFIRMAYRSILLREAEEAALSNALALLQKGYVGKEEYLYSMMNSDEGKRVGIKVTGIKKGRRKTRLRRRLAKIPVLGRCLWKEKRKLRVVSGKALLKFSGERFVREAYQKVLLREADAAAVANAVGALQRREICKAELLCSLEGSLEGMRQDVHVSGVRARCRWNRFHRRILRIPLLGAVLRWAEAAACLPGRLKCLEYCLSECRDSIYSLKQEINHAKERTETFQVEMAGIKVWTEQETKSFYELEDRAAFLEEQARWQEEKIKALQDLEGSVRQMEFGVRGLHLFRDAYEKERLRREEGIEREKEARHRRDRLMDGIYLHYNEKLMTDSRESIKEAMRAYLPYVEKRFSSEKKENLRMLDIGCGEGEWLELLEECGYRARGIDSNQAVVEKALREHPGLDIVRNEAMGYLSGEGNDMLDMISCIHMVEHLEFEEIIEFLQECFRVLKKGGMLLLETPNPHNILTATYYFHMDPTHRKIIPQELLKFMVEECGFRTEGIRLLKPLDFIPYSYDDSNDKVRDIVFRFNMEQAYSVMAVKD